MYNVFLSFRGEESRAKFMSHLYSSLQNAGIYTFRDDDEIQRGDQISISTYAQEMAQTWWIFYLFSGIYERKWRRVGILFIFYISTYS
ncbi:disease resistance protein (TIR-NBS-LRR class) [Medicago truncatula]|uniref:Disease resistance protein (TIR-NBS-LRR class) n=1 Tax=Medicago truncatula TaxID=3880 RepID=G7JSC8_MEDTR|nr:disease resistance protein (TIR-NBS-LRR class) [Medicago truncatula]